MNNIAEIQLFNFCLVYLLLLIVLFIMKKCEINQSKLLFVASIRMTLQLIIAGFVLTYIFQNPHPIFTILYLLAMIIFAIHRVLSKNPNLNHRFKLAIIGSISFSGLAVLAFFILVVVKEDFFHPQYVIPLSGMIMGNAMTGVNLGVKTFRESLQSERSRIEALLNFGVTPQKILTPFVNQALESALLPTLNSMVGMGIVALPGLMTGQILSGTLPNTAILYQISIMIAICTAVCLSVFGSLYFGYRSLYNKDQQITL
ncbi:ABC transporter permease [Gallibacterium anatis]|uniref:Iron export ABC transporter permease subunit FetB n=1 Tax=Gallibacterium anatis TaxID=750 RepID=A0A921L112_9PAST|nr:iron export ABC transporter permease subunit FetB [Gallibacterium anatis]MBP4134357.1 iron export ABC transporter permease subunit FetB [Gallibacterium anatis]HJF73522.1 iron export ABC transporter permease subunit FetB [Gallibacterium anatis]